MRCKKTDPGEEDQFLEGNKPRVNICGKKNGSSPALFLGKTPPFFLGGDPPLVVLGSTSPRY